jgi:hypothetical protein
MLVGLPELHSAGYVSKEDLRVQQAYQHVHNPHKCQVTLCTKLSIELDHGVALLPLPSWQLAGLKLDRHMVQPPCQHISWSSVCDMLTPAAHATLNTNRSKGPLTVTVFGTAKPFSSSQERSTQPLHPMIACGTCMYCVAACSVCTV